jgi:hypothetical protein
MGRYVYQYSFDFPETDSEVILEEIRSRIDKCQYPPVDLDEEEAEAVDSLIHYMSELEQDRAYLMNLGKEIDKAKANRRFYEIFDWMTESRAQNNAAPREQFEVEVNEDKFRAWLYKALEQLEWAFKGGLVREIDGRLLLVASEAEHLGSDFGLEDISRLLPALDLLPPGTVVNQEYQSKV